MSPTTVISRIAMPPKGTFASDVLVSPPRPIRTYLPEHYERKYAYPLVVFFHEEGANEESALQLAPQVSDRNFIAIALRGTQALATGEGGLPGFGWDNTETDDLEEYVVRAVEETRRRYHVHSERIYFAGVGEGTLAAYRAGFRLANRIAGIAALNGPFPTPERKMPLFRMDDLRRLRIFIGHGIANTHIPCGLAEKAHKLMYAARANVPFRTYGTNRSIHPDMLRDVNRWIIGNLNAEIDRLILQR